MIKNQKQIAHNFENPEMVQCPAVHGPTYRCVLCSARKGMTFLQASTGNSCVGNQMENGGQTIVFLTVMVKSNTCYHRVKTLYR